MNPSLPGRAIALVATIVVSAAAGWFARAPAAADAPPPSAPATLASIVNAASAPEPAPLIAVSGDGNVTLHVQQQPLEWVLEQIAAQSGWRDVKERARPTAAAAGVAPSSGAPEVETVCAPSTAAAVDTARILQAIEHPGEAQRFDALMQARSEGLVVPEATLRALMDSDASDRVRLAAFDSLLESRLDPRLLREALQAALYAPSGVIQREAKRRLDELQEMERIDAQFAQGAS